MENEVSAAAAAALGAAISAVNLRGLQYGGGGAAAAPAQGAPPLLHGGNRELLLLTTTGVLFTAAGHTYRHVRQAGAGNRRLPGVLTFTLCASAGALEYLVFVLPPVGDGGGADPGDQAARALGLAARGALPAAATVTFYMGMLLIVVRHIRAGGEGGGGVVAGDEPIRAPVGVLVKMAWAAAAALVCLSIMAVAF
ncbi:hypothetical protein BS78_10G078300 [Paspalum vaginatum]|nr:hypothetical protein BS78_10G078300 [Paspalum vaginatum]